jgi:hypothetical protein
MTQMSSSVWISGSTLSGKTTRLIDQGQTWLQQRSAERKAGELLVFAATGDNRIQLADRILSRTNGRLRFDSTTPLGFIQSEVQLFWPLLRQQLGLATQFPIRLRPEKEQELATQLWQAELEQGLLQMEGVREFFQVRRVLDLIQLAAFAAVPIEDIPPMMREGWQQSGSTELWDIVGNLCQRWRQWCLSQGLLTYGLMTELYWRELLPHPLYRQRLRQRYWGILADDVDEYPAIARPWFECLMDQEAVAAFTFNPDGQVRLGQGADPPYLQQLAARCEVIPLESPATNTIGATWASEIIRWVDDPFSVAALPDVVQSIQTTSRAQLLRQIAETIAQAVHQGEVQPQDIAIIGPGLDAIARYTLSEILAKRGIGLTILNDQRPLISSPIVRSLLTLLALVYPNLGRWIDQDAIAEMLIVFSQRPVVTAGQSWIDLARIDPIRAELIADHCFEPHPDQPRLLPVTAFSRWDRLGHQATEAYAEILDWLNGQIQQQQEHLIPTVVTLLDRTMQRFLWRGSHLPYDQLAVLRELMETAQHHWDVETRLQRHQSPDPAQLWRPSGAIAALIQLLRSGAVTADPYPSMRSEPASHTVILSTVYQYRAQRLTHPWQFWLDASSPRWLTGDDSRFGAPVFWRERSLRPWTAEDALNAGEARLRRILRDLLSRTERVVLCHSDLSTIGQDQTGPLQILVNGASIIPDVTSPDAANAADSADAASDGVSTSPAATPFTST